MVGTHDDGNHAPCRSGAAQTFIYYYGILNTKIIKVDIKNV